MNTSAHNTSIAIINTCAPYGQANGQESLDLALAAGSFGQQVSLFFIDDGVLQLLKQQSPQQIEYKNYSKTFAALEFYDIEHAYVCQNSLQQRGLTAGQLCIDANIIELSKLQDLLKQHSHIVTF